MRLGGDAGGAAAVMTFAAWRPWIAAVGHGAGGHVPDGQARVVMMDAARRCAVENFDRGVRRARGEHPIIAGVKSLGSGGCEADRHAVFQQQRRARRGNRDHAGRAGCVEILHLDRRAAGVGAEHLVRSDPSGGRADYGRVGTRCRGSFPAASSAGSAGVNWMRRVASIDGDCAASRRRPARTRARRR